jgi:hypothetical protein
MLIQKKSMGIYVKKIRSQNAELLTQFWMKIFK